MVSIKRVSLKLIHSALGQAVQFGGIFQKIFQIQIGQMVWHCSLFSENEESFKLVKREAGETLLNKKVTRRFGAGSKYNLVNIPSEYFPQVQLKVFN